MATGNIATNDILRTSFVCVADLQWGMMTAYTRCTATTDNSITLVEYASLISERFATEIRTLLSSQAVYAGSLIQSVYPTPLSDLISSVTDAGVGLWDSQLLPTQVSGLFKLGTTQGGRANRGRKYMPFPGKSASSDTTHRPTAEYLGGLNNLADLYVNLQQLTGAAGTATFEFGLWKGRPSTGAFLAFTYRTTRQAWATQRRRGSLGKTNV